VKSFSEKAKLAGIELTPYTKYFAGERISMIGFILAELGHLGRKSGKYRTPRKFSGLFMSF
jgi:hypothetical protein